MTDQGSSQGSSVGPSHRSRSHATPHAGAKRHVGPPRGGSSPRADKGGATNRQLAHLVGCNGVFSALLRTARSRADCALDEWWSARRCAGAWGEIVRPDAYAVRVEHEVRLPFCLEYDAGTETLARLKAKLDGYARLARAVGHATWLLIRFPSVGRHSAARRVLAHPEVPVASLSPQPAVLRAAHTRRPRHGRIDTARRSSKSPASTTGVPYRERETSPGGSCGNGRDRGVPGLDGDRRGFRLRA